MDREGSNGIRILIADDHPILREGLRKLLDAEVGFSVIGESADGTEAVKVARQLEPDVLLLDLAMPRSSGLEALRELAASQRPVRAILLVETIEKDQLIEALQLGARGVVPKNSTTQLLVKAIRCVMAGQYWLDGECVCDVVQALRDLWPHVAEKTHKKTFGLTARELEIVETVVSGYVNKDIAEKFSISQHTVKHHLTNIFDKLGVSNRLELALFAVHHRLLNGEGIPAIVGDKVL
jgi:two-component system, NarL family, nitrate/nitrite response regulator NarL